MPDSSPDTTPAIFVAPATPPPEPTPSALAELLGSKKLVMALLALLCALAAHLGLHFTPEQAFEWVSPFLAAILAQGVADHGKEKAKIEARANVAMVTSMSAPLVRLEAPTGTLKIAGTGAGLGILFLLALGAASSHGCGPGTQRIVHSAEGAGSSFLRCEKVDLAGYVKIGGKSLPLIATVAADLRESNYDQLVADLVSQLGRDAVGCAVLAVADVEAPTATGSGGGPSTAAQSPVALRASEQIQKYGFARAPVATNSATESK